MFHLRSRALVGPRIGLCGSTASCEPEIKAHFKQRIAQRYGLNTDCEFYPKPEAAPAATAKAQDKAKDAKAAAGASGAVVQVPPYVTALKAFSAGDVVTVFTPDDTHFAIAMEAIASGCHVLIAKPAVKTLAHHLQLIARAREHNVLAAVEVHKRYDPIYVDARNKIRSQVDFGADFNYFVSYMSQPKHQLDTFRGWAGVNGNDISYYLNAHHIDFHAWCMAGRARPLHVSALASTGVAQQRLGNACEDTITLSVQWQNTASGALGTAVYTSSWVAPKSDVHSQQRFFYLGSKGEVTVDQAHRGYTTATDDGGYASCNPLFFTYTPDSAGRFAGQRSYGYLSFELFVEAVRGLRNGSKTLAQCDNEMATLASTAVVTAVLEAGRRSLDAGGAAIDIVYDDKGQPVDLRPRVLPAAAPAVAAAPAAAPVAAATK